jgi:hypothetical protein
MRDRKLVHALDAFAPRIERLEARIAPSGFAVTNLRNMGPGSLRDAIDQANSRMGDDNIVFASKLKGPIKLKSPIEITDDVRIDGLGKKIGITGKSKTQLFVIEGAGIDVDLISLKLKKGFGESGGALSIDDPGGTVTITNCLFTKNAAVGTKGSAASMDGGVASGGAIRIEAGTLIIRQSKITGNRAIGGDGFTDTRTVDGSPYTYEYAGGDAKGGAIDAAEGTAVTISDSKLTKNSVVSGKGLGTSAALGGAITSEGMLEVRNSVVSKNSANGEGVAAGGGVHSLGDGSFTNVTISSNSASTANGAKGTAAHGGGVFHGEGQTLTVVQSTITGNTAFAGNATNGAKGRNGARGMDGGNGYNGEPGEDGADGDYGYAGGDADGGEDGEVGGDALGGGIFNAGTLTLQTSTISGNKAMAGDGGNGGNGGDGGRGGDGGNGGDGGRAVNEGGYSYPMGYGGSGGDGGNGGRGGDGGGGGNGGNARGGGVFNGDTAIFTQTSTISGNTTQAGIGGVPGDHGSGGAGGAGGKKGQGRAGDGGEYDYSPEDGERGQHGGSGADGSRGMPGAATGPDVFSIIAGVTPFETAALGNFGRLGGSGIQAIEYAPAESVSPLLLESIREFVVRDFLNPAWVGPSAEVQLAAVRLEALGMGAVGMWGVANGVLEGEGGELSLGP